MPQLKWGRWLGTVREAGSLDIHQQRGMFLVGFQEEEVMAVTLLLVAAGWEEQGDWRPGARALEEHWAGGQSFI